MNAAPDATRHKLPIGFGPALFAILLVIAPMLGLAFAYALGSQRHTERRHDWARTVAQENEAFCSKFGFASGTALHVECTASLADLRMHHELHVRTDMR